MATEAASTEMSEDQKGWEPAAKHWRFVPLLLIVLGLGFGYAMGWHRYLTLDFLADSRLALKAFVAANAVAAPLGFTLLYAVAVAFSFPAASVLTIFSGFLFGWLFGGVLAIVGATVGATVLFLAARTAFGGFLRERAGCAAARLSRGFERDAFSYLLVLRIAPFIPFFVVNIAPAVFNVRLRTFVVATLIGILPGAFAYAWLGQGVDSVLVAARQAGREVAVGDLVTPEITVAFAALALVAALAAVVRKFWLRAA
jgi:uncharacterized membrane protein YdjX (TVP38/TMEM64 family)